MLRSESMPLLRRLPWERTLSPTPPPPSPMAAPPLLLSLRRPRSSRPSAPIRRSSGTRRRHLSEREGNRESKGEAADTPPSLRKRNLTWLRPVNPDVSAGLTGRSQVRFRLRREGGVSAASPFDSLFPSRSERCRRRVPLLRRIGADGRELRGRRSESSSGGAAIGEGGGGVGESVRSQGNRRRSGIDSDRSIVDQVADHGGGKATRLHPGSRARHDGIIAHRGATGAEKHALTGGRYLVARSCATIP